MQKSGREEESGQTLLHLDVVWNEVDIVLDLEAWMPRFGQDEVSPTCREMKIENVWF